MKTDLTDTGACRVLLTGGGTGGHVYPCLSIYSMLKEHGCIEDAMFVGVRGRAEEKIVPRYNVPIQYISAAPVVGSSLPGLMRAFMPIMRGIAQSLGIISSFRPNLVIATGGYVSAPVLFAAFLLKKRLGLTIVVEEQNLVPGLLNKVASLLADVVLVNFRKSVYFTWHRRAVFVGYPLRSDFYLSNGDSGDVRKSLDIPDGTHAVLITGGSLGARSINHLVVDSILELEAIPDLLVFHSIGLNESRDYHALRETRQLLKAKLGLRFDEESLTARRDDGRVFYRGFPFIHDMMRYQLAADLIISRAGAGTIAEIAAVAKPAILIPKRGLSGDHQELNALNIAEQQACEVFFEHRDRNNSGQDVIDNREFVVLIRELLADPDRRRRLAANITAFHHPNSPELIASTILRIAKKQPVNFIEEIIEPQFVQFQRSFDHLIMYLDAVRRNRETGNPYLRFYRRKVEEYLDSPDFLEVNKGIKLIGALQRTDCYPWIEKNFSNWKGYLRRNALISLQKSPVYQPFFRKMVLLGLDDNYYEVRREAVRLFRFFNESFDRDREVHERIIKQLSKSFESFEVKAEIIRALIHIVDPDRFYQLTERFLTSRNIRLREALLEAIREAIIKQRLPRNEQLKIFLKRMMITTSEFKPEFTIRENYVTVLRELEGVENGKAHH